MENSTEPPAGTAIVAVDWIGFFILFGSSAILCYKLMTFKGPTEQPVDYFFGYREAKMLPVYVNLFAAVAYWLKVSAHANGDVGTVHDLDSLKYAEYLFTCPILTIDLLWTLNLPYKFTFGANILICIVCATFSSLFEAPARYMWFVLGSVLFGVTWTAIVTLVRRRLEQFYSSNIYSKNIRKETKSMLRTALFAYFSLWVAYPLLWILLEVNLINETVSHCLHVFLDVSAKSAYGFAMLRFQLSSERREFTLDPLQNLDMSKILETVGTKVSVDEEDEAEKEDDDFASVIKGRVMSPRIGSRRPSTQLPVRATATPKAARMLSPLMSPMRTSAPAPQIEPFYAGGERSRPSRSETPEGGSPRVRRISIEPRGFTAARRRTIEGDPGDAMQQINTMQQLASLNEQLTRLLQQQTAASQSQSVSYGGGGGGRYAVGGNVMEEGSNTPLCVPPYRWDNESSGMPIQLSHRPDHTGEVSSS